MNTRVSPAILRIVPRTSRVFHSPAMSGRVRGYTYKRRRDGTRYRSYRRYGRARATIPRKRFLRTRRARIVGFGAYYKKAGSAYGRPPQIVNHPDGRVIIRHQEYLEDVPSATSFALATYPLNPGMSQTFPWLSRIAQNFEEWLPRGIYFMFKTTSSDMIVTGVTTPALGQVSMATQYNALDNNFQNNVQLLNYENASTAKPSQNLKHFVECKRSQTVMDEMYIRTGPIPPNADLRLYDLGKTSVSTSNMQTNGQMMGQLWIAYEIELRKPKIPQETIVGISNHWKIPTGTAGLSFVTPFGNATQTGLSPIPATAAWPNALVVGQASGGRVVLTGALPGTYLIVHRGACTNTTMGTFTINTVSGCTATAIWENNNVAVVQGSGIIGNSQRLGSATISVTAPDPVFEIGWVSDAGTPNVICDLFITQLS